MDAWNQCSFSWGSSWCGFCWNLCQFLTLSVSCNYFDNTCFPTCPGFQVLWFWFLSQHSFSTTQDLIKDLSTPAPNSKDLHFPSKYSQSFTVQCNACFWKQHWSYWRNPQYNAIRFFMTIIIGILFGLIFWNKGQQT